MSEALIVDSFAGGGGASTGIEMALGRSPDIAINHDADALAMHQVNHPDTLHLSKNIWQVDPMDAVGRRRVGLAWFSPDCKHHSKAKGGRPVKRNIRDLAWVVVLWAKRVRPEVIMLENVEEFRDWGPLIETDKGFRPDPARKGQTFNRWAGELRRLGYRLEFRELRACDYGAPTIRKRLFMIARRDGRPIVWPQPTHGPPDDIDVIAGRKLPWRTAAQIIDWTLPCPSIFDSAAEIKAKYGLRAIRPLADATMRRIAKGVVRYVLEAERPFLISVAHGYSGGRREYPLDEPIGTMTSAGNAHALVSPTLIQTGYGERPGQAPRVPHVDKPIGTQVAGAAKHAVVAAHLSRFTQNGVGQHPAEPLDTVMPGAPKFGVVAAFLAQHNTGVVGHDARDPVSTVTQRGTQQHVVAAHLMNMKGSDRRDGPIDAPGPTICAGGGHASLVSAFLTKYYGEGLPNQAANEPLHTVTSKPRHGVVSVSIDGQSFVIADIGMRMLTPRERFRAQGFPESYIIDHGPDGKQITATAQGSCCGNSVCPPLAEALVGANCGHLARIREAAE